MKMKCVLIFTALFIAGCSSNNLHEEQMTVGKVQREIRVGMSSAEVVEVMGSPNIVTTDDQRRETWVYDRTSQQVSSGGSGVWILIAHAGSSSRSSNSRTLTVIIKFDEQHKVRDFAYRASTF